MTNEIFIVEFEPEGNEVEVFHNHLDCPVCKVERSGTSIFQSVASFVREGESRFLCSNCGTAFEILSLDSEDSEKANVKRVR